MKKIKIFYLKNCDYCKDLMKKLKENNIYYESIDVNQYPDIYNKIFIKTKVDAVPVILIDKYIISPTISFNTIDEAIKIIKMLLEDEK